MSTAKAHAAPSGRICENIFGKHTYIKLYLFNCVPFDE